MPIAAPSAALFSREKILQAARTMPADLQVLSSLGEMLQDVNSELDDIAGLLRRDLALAARIVRIANSPLFGGGSRIASVEEAVNRVGFGEILKLVGTASAARFSERALELYGIGAQKLRDNMLYGAIAAEALARAAGIDPRVAYTAGLLRPLGLMVLDRAGRGGSFTGQKYDSLQWESYSAWEGSLFGVDNCDVAAMILEEWKFPAELSRSIRAHYLAQTTDYDRPLAVVLNLASALAHRTARSFPGESRWWPLAERKLQVAGIAEEYLAPAAEEAEATFTAAVAALSL
ncbi:MAG TPA: HDOD domain-containing protein [Opitutaceae bacterium]